MLAGPLNQHILSMEGEGGREEAGRGAETLQVTSYY